jgi:hypothetical protein
MRACNEEFRRQNKQIDDPSSIQSVLLSQMYAVHQIFGQKVGYVLILALKKRNTPKFKVFS